jgi:CheY-like chemotaxis protein
MPRSARPCHTYVLIVEDDRAIRDSLSEVLVDEGCRVRAAADGRRALEICQTPPTPDLILLDLRMPVMDGLEFASVIQADPALSRVPICVMTASGPSAPLPKNAVAVLRKPIGMAELRAIVTRFCGALPGS